MNYTTILILTINQLIIHVIFLILIEILLFYFIIKTNTTKELEFFLNKLKLGPILRASGFPTFDLTNTRDFVGEWIEASNSKALFIIVILLLSLFLALFLSYYITGTFEYNLITTISSLIISVPIQLVYMFEFNIKKNPRLELVVKEKFNKALTTYIDSL